MGNFLCGHSLIALANLISKGMASSRVLLILLSILLDNLLCLFIVFVYHVANTVIFAFFFFLIFIEIPTSL